MSENFSYIRVDSSNELVIDDENGQNAGSPDVNQVTDITVKPNSNMSSGTIKPDFYDPNDPKYSSYTVTEYSNNMATVEMNDDGMSSELRLRNAGSKKYTGVGSGFLDRNGFSWLMEQTIDEDDEDYNSSIL